MRQIRQKKQLLRNTIRKEQLQNHFKTLRKKYFDFSAEHNELNNNQQNVQTLSILLAKSQEFNKLAFQIREKNLFNELNFLVESAIKKQDKLETKYLLTIIPNIFRDEINPYEKEYLFKISIKLFQSLNVSFINFNSKQERKAYKNTLTSITSEVLIYYISNVIFQSQFLQEQDQQLIEKNFYPALMNLLFYSLKHPKLIQTTQQFCSDFERAILNIFDFKQCQYETGNRYKAKRNQLFFSDIVMNHYFYLSENRQSSDLFVWIQNCLYFLYDKLTEYIAEIREFFSMKELWMIIEEGFQTEVVQQNSKKMTHIYSIIRTMIDNDSFLNEISQLMMTHIHELSMPNFQIIMQTLSYNVPKQFQILQFLEGIMISYLQKDNFKQIISIYGMKIFEILTNIFLEVDRKSLSDRKQRKILIKTLQIIYVFIQKENKSIEIKPNQYTIYFERAQGTRKFIQIEQWSQDYDLKNNSDLTDILEFVDWLSNQFEFTNSDEQVDI